MLKKISTIIALLLLVCSTASAQTFGLYKGFSFTAGATYLYRGWNGSIDGQKPPMTLMNIGVDIFMFHVGFDAMRRNTGRDIYGYREFVVSQHFKFGITLQYDFGDSGQHTSTKVLFTPYIGSGAWLVNDASGNDIGARTHYNNREKFTSVGLRVQFRPKETPFCFGVDASTHSVGAVVGIAL